MPSANQRAQRFFQSHEQLLVAAEEYNAQGYDTFFGLATFQEQGNRRQDNVASLSALFLDLDCGTGKGYADQQAALLALRGFCKALALPKPTIVSSGGGLHIYWFLSNPLPWREWKRLAEALKRACVENKLHADPAVTGDAARVLRIPGTNNYKGDAPRPVTVLAYNEQCIDAEDVAAKLHVAAPAAPALAPYEGPAAPNEDKLHAVYKDNRQSRFRKLFDLTVAGKGCAQIANIIANRATLEEPLWRAGLSIATHCVDADKAIHIISKGHPDYNRGQVEEKAARVKGPYTCATFDSLRPNVCQDCPHWNNIRSPITLAREVKEAEAVDGIYVDVEPATDVLDAVAPTQDPVEQYHIPVYPKPYIRGAKGGVYVRIARGDEVEERCVYHNDFYIVKRIRDPELGDVLLARLHLPVDGVREIVIPMTAATSRDGLRLALSHEGMTVLKVDELAAYVMAWVRHLEFTAVEVAHNMFGWTDDTMQEFVLGAACISAKGRTKNPRTKQTEQHFSAFSAKGDLAKWKETVELWNEPRFVLQQYVLGCGFGSVLVPLTNVNAMLFHMHSKESGVGKTTTLLAALGIWGDPDLVRLKVADTYNFKMNRAEVYHNIPWGIDEVTNSPATEYSNLLYDITQGRQKGRMSGSANTERFQGEPWQLIALTTGNVSVVERLQAVKGSPQAEAQRALEYYVPRLFLGAQSKTITDEFEHSIKTNFGLAGPVFVQYLIDNMEEVREDFKAIQMRVDEQAALSAENRFWSAQAACAIGGLVFAKRAGLVNFDVKPVLSWVVNDLLVKNRRATEEMVRLPEDIMADFFSEHISNILQIKSSTDSRSTDNRMDLDETLIIPEQVARGKLVARYETDTKKFFVKTNELRAWCADMQYNYGQLVIGLKQYHEGVYKKVRLMKGTNMSMPATDVVVMRFTGNPTVAQGESEHGTQDT